MFRRDDNEEPALDYPHCGRSFHSFARLEDHVSEQEGTSAARHAAKRFHGPSTAVENH